MKNIFKEFSIILAIVSFTIIGFYYGRYPFVGFVFGVTVGSWIMAIHVLYIYKKRTGQDFPSPNKKDNK